MDEFTTEQSELLLWVQQLLITEEDTAADHAPEGSPAPSDALPGGEVEPTPPQRSEAVPARDQVSPSAQQEHGSTRRADDQPRRIGDAVLEEAWPSTEDTDYCVVTVEPVPEGPSSSAADGKDTILKTLIQVAPPLLRRRDRIHRTTQGRVALVLAKTNEAGAAIVVTRLERRLGLELASRGLGPVKLKWTIADSSPSAPGRDVGLAAGAGG
jgi:hypothetical protein